MNLWDRIKAKLGIYEDLDDLTDRPDPVPVEDKTFVPHPRFRQRVVRPPADGSFETVDSIEPDFEQMDAPVAMPYDFYPGQHKLKRVDGKWYIE